MFWLPASPPWIDHYDIMIINNYDVLDDYYPMSISYPLLNRYTCNLQVIQNLD